MSQISREEALDIARKDISMLPHIEITDQWNDGWRIYGSESLSDCWYVSVSPSLTGSSVGASYFLAISKKDGRILYSGPVGE